MRRFWKLLAVTGVTALAVGTAGMPAGATPPTGYGFDGQPHVVVGGGSDTTYKSQLLLTELYMSSSIQGCEHVVTVGANLNKCTPVVGAEVNKNLGNYQGDTFAQANPTGSSAGIASLNVNPNSATSDAGAVRPASYTCPNATVITSTGPNVDFARSSRGPNLTGGASPCSGNELDVDTFWGIGQDGIEVAAFTAGRGAELQALAAPNLTPNQVFNVWNCTGGTGTGGRMRWSDLLPSLAGQARGNALIEPWGMNPSAGTFASFRSWVTNNATGVPAGWSPNAQSCVRKLPSGLFPLENDIKEPADAPAALSAVASSPDNPDNWMHWGSFGVLSANTYLSNYTRSGIAMSYIPAPINGITPSSARIIANTYPIGRTVYHVTLKGDADCPKTAGACDFIGQPGPTIPATGGTDFNVTGGTSGVAGAIREYTRWICRGTAAQHGKNPYNGINMFSEITTRINIAGFTVVPSALRTPGSRCQVLS